MLTPFGIEVRKLRLDRRMRLLDLANALGKKPAYVSAVETGKKALSVSYVEHVVAVLKLTDEEAERLRRAADRTRKEVVVDELSADDRELVAAFARKMNELPDDFLRKLREKVFRSLSGSTPFSRRHRGFTVPPLSTLRLWDFADQVRDVFVDNEEVPFPIMDVLEFRLQQFFGGFSLEVGSREHLGPEEGRVVPGSLTIELREDVYEGAWNDQGRDRFTACHELAHFLIHREVGLSRAQRSDFEPIYRDSEWQADTFAGALMMSRRHAQEFVDEVDAAAECKMTPHAAIVMLNKYREKGFLDQETL